MAFCRFFLLMPNFFQHVVTKRKGNNSIKKVKPLLFQGDGLCFFNRHHLLFSFLNLKTFLVNFWVFYLFVVIFVERHYSMRVGFKSHSWIVFLFLVLSFLLIFLSWYFSKVYSYYICVICTADFIESNLLFLILVCKH